MDKRCKQCKEFKEILVKGLCLKCYRGKYRLENKEKVSKQAKKYRLANPGKCKERHKRYCAENLEKLKAYKKKYKLENKEKMKAYYRKYLLENPGKARENKLKRRGYGIVKKGVVGRIINENIFKYGVITCEQCRESCKNNYHIDHIIPVSRDGSNEYNNLQILCAKHNREKGIKIMDYRQSIENNQLCLK